MPAVLVKTAFIDNPADAKLLVERTDAKFQFRMIEERRFDLTD